MNAPAATTPSTASAGSRESASRGGASGPCRQGDAFARLMRDKMAQDGGAVVPSATGLAGAVGGMGMKGASGASGASGAGGASGASGPGGAKGATGETGAHGSATAKGGAGAPGGIAARAGTGSALADAEPGAELRWESQTGLDAQGASSGVPWAFAELMPPPALSLKAATAPAGAMSETPASTPEPKSATAKAVDAIVASQAPSGNGTVVNSAQNGVAEPAGTWEVSISDPRGVGIELRASRPATAQAVPGQQAPWNLTIAAPARDIAMLAQQVHRLDERLRARATGATHVRIEEEEGDQ